MDARATGISFVRVRAWQTNCQAVVQAATAAMTHTTDVGYVLFSAGGEPLFVGLQRDARVEIDTNGTTVDGQALDVSAGSAFAGGDEYAFVSARVGGELSRPLAGGSRR